MYAEDLKNLHPIISKLLKKPPKEVKEIILPNDLKGLNTEKELKSSLQNPINSKPLDELVNKKDTIAIVTLDDSRTAPQQEMIKAILNEIQNIKYKDLFIVIANGTHKKIDPKVLGLSKNVLSKFKIYNHDARNEDELVEIGKVTSRFHELNKRILNNTDIEMLQHVCRDAKDKEIFKKKNLQSKGIVKLNKKIFEADVIILLGSIKPHYFAGYSGGAKSLIPGLADRRFIIRNHLLKIHPKSNLGLVEGNLVREEIEEAAKLFRKKVFCLNVILNKDREIIKAVSGDIIQAHRKGVEYAKQVFEVEAKKANVIVVSDRYPVSMDIKQTKKVVGAAGKIVKKDGVIIVVANCEKGIGSSSKINDLVYKLNLRNKLPKNVSLLLISDLHKEEVETTGFFDYILDIKSALKFAEKKLNGKLEICIIPYGSLVVPIIKGGGS